MKNFFVGLGASAVVIAALAVLAWFIIADIQSKQVVGVSVPAAPAKEVKAAPTKGVTVKRPVRVFTGDTKAKLKLPDSVVKDENQQVLAATQVKATDRPQTVTTVINTETGQSETFVRQDPLPWFAIETRGIVQVAAGFKYALGNDAKPVVRLNLGYDVVRVKALTGGVMASVDSDGAAFAGVGVAYRW